LVEPDAFCYLLVGHGLAAHGSAVPMEDTEDGCLAELELSGQLDTATSGFVGSDDLGQGVSS
jgi:hypothetical protein